MPLRNSWRRDVPAAIVLVLIALPLCLGISLAAGAPLTAGLIAGVVGGLLVGGLSASPVMVSGPAAGLTAVVIAGIVSAGSFRAFLVSVVLAGLLQLLLSRLRAGVIGYFFPSSVIRGMLAGIGVTLILKQLPHAIGYDVDFEGDESFWQANNETTFSALGNMLGAMHPGAIIVTLLSLAVLLAWDRWRPDRLRVLPAALLAVIAGIAANAVFPSLNGTFVLAPSHLVQLPVAQSPLDWLAFLVWPDWTAIASPATWRIAATIAVVASLETLLSLDATDKMDPFKRESDTDRELRAQGVGNVVSGLLGGLPIAGVIVRSAANIDAGAQTRRSTMIHGGLLLAVVLALPVLLNLIPLASLAAILLYTGYKLASPALFRMAWAQGAAQFTPFAVTLVAIVVTDLLLGIGIGLSVGFFFILREHLRQPALRQVSGHGAVLTRYVLPDQATFLSKANIERTLEAVPPGARIEIDGRNTTRFDPDVLEQLHEFAETARLRNIDYRMVGIPAAETTPIHTL
jgi:carbonic anhydrase